MMAGIMLSSRSYHNKDENLEDEQLRRSIEKNKHRIINL
jgi:hypothetical protein